MPAAIEKGVNGDCRKMRCTAAVNLNHMKTKAILTHVSRIDSDGYRSQSTAGDLYQVGKDMLVGHELVSSQASTRLQCNDLACMRGKPGRSSRTYREQISEGV